MDKSELQALIKETVESTVSEKVDEAVAPLKEQATQNFPYVNTGHESEKNTPPKSNGIGAARFVRALANSGGDPERAKRFAEKTWNDDLGKHVQKALAAGDFNAGGFMVPPGFSEEIIELLRSRNVVRRAGPMQMNLPNGSMTIPRQTGASSASYVGENASVNASEVSGGQITLTAKKLIGKVAISNELLQYDSGDAADQLVRRDLVQVLSTEEDKSFLRGDGLNGAPKGLKNWAANSSTSNGDTLANIRADLKQMNDDLALNDVPMENLAVFMSERERSALQYTVTDSDGRLVFAEEVRNGSIAGWPIFSTTHIPTNLGGGTESEVMLADLSQVIIGDLGTIQIDASTEASFADTSGNTQSAFDNDSTIIRAKLQHDLAARHNEAISVIDTVTWGA